MKSTQLITLLILLVGLFTIYNFQNNLKHRFEAMKPEIQVLTTNFTQPDQTITSCGTKKIANPASTVNVIEYIETATSDSSVKILKKAIGHLF